MGGHLQFTYGREGGSVGSLAKWFQEGMEGIAAGAYGMREGVTLRLISHKGRPQGIGGGGGGGLHVTCPDRVLSILLWPEFLNYISSSGFLSLEIPKTP